MNRLKLSALAAGVAILGGAGFLLNGLPTVAQASDMTVYKSDSCGCCGGWVEHMRKPATPSASSPPTTWPR